MNSNAPTTRAAIKAERLALHASDQEIAAVMIADKLLRMTSLQRAKNIGVDFELMQQRQCFGPVTHLGL